MKASCIAASKEAPIANPPQFVVIMSDDNSIPEGARWMPDALGKTTNADGSKRYMSFYANYDHPDIYDSETRNGMINALYEAYKMGHEIGNHTSTHLLCVEFGKIDANGADTGKKIEKEVIDADIKKVEQVLTVIGIPAAHQVGFRTPYLRHSDRVFRAVTDAGFLYDCSITAANNNAAGDGFWPYTLDIIPGKQEPDENGNLPPDNNASVNTWGQTSPIGEYKGLWEIPSSHFAIHPDDMDYVAGVYSRKLGKESNFNGHITGLDWDMWHVAELNADQTLRSLIYTLEQTLAGNRAPFTVGVHSQFYIEPKDIDFPRILPHERRAVFEAFIKYASRLKDVFFVSSDMVIRWMQNPVSAEGYKPENYLRT